MRNSLTLKPRHAAKRSVILSRLRSDILEGRFPPGSQLPTRSVMEREFGVSSVTLQRALDQLIEHGFVHARGTAGTYVAEHPPFLSRYGLVMTHDDRILSTRPAVLDDGAGGRIVGWQDGDLAAMELPSYETEAVHRAAMAPFAAAAAESPPTA